MTTTQTEEVLGRNWNGFHCVATYLHKMVGADRDESLIETYERRKDTSKAPSPRIIAQACGKALSQRSSSVLNSSRAVRRETQGAIPHLVTEEKVSIDSSKKSLASIIVVAHDGGIVIRDCLDSVKNLQWSPLEVIVVDNASTDNTLEEVWRVLPTARIISLPVNRGYGAGGNAGARIARGDILVFLNQDVYLSTTFLDRIASKMVEDKRIGVCGGIVLSWDGKHLVSAGQIFDKWTGYGLDYGFGSSDVSLRRDGDEIFSPNGAAFAVRQETFRRIGGFNEDFFMYFDETDLAWRARTAGYRVCCCRDATVRHKIDPQRAHNVWSRYYIERNSLLSAVRNYELSTLIIFLPTSLMVRISGMIVLALFRRAEHARSTAKALTDFFTILPKAWRQRRLLFDIRRLRDRDVMRKDLLATPVDVLRVFFSSLLPSTSDPGDGVP